MLQPFRAAASYRSQPQASAVSDREMPRAFTVTLLALTLGAVLQAVAVGIVATTRVSPASANATTTGGAVADWTVLVYMASDNNLEAAALTNLREIANVGSSTHIKIVAQVDRITSRAIWDDTTAGDWAATKRFLVEPGMEPDAAAAVQDLGERNSIQKPSVL